MQPIRDRTVSADLGTDTITLECNGPIASGSAAYNLYSLYDAGWLPKSASNRNAFLMGSADSVELILHK